MGRRVTPEGREIGARIKAARQAAGLSQEALADAVAARRGQPVKQSAISGYEAGIRPGEPLMIAIADVLGIAAGWLHYGAASGAPAPAWWTETAPEEKEPDAPIRRRTKMTDVTDERATRKGRPGGA